MPNNQELKELLEKIEKNTELQKRYTQWECIMSITMVLSCIILVGLAYWATKDIIPIVEESLIAVDTVTKDLAIISEQLIDADLVALVEHVDKMAVTSEKGVGQALEKINSIDIEELNQAIQGLSDVVGPLAKMTSIFR